MPRVIAEKSMCLRKGDMPRHMRTHAQDKSKLMHRCPVCGFENMQKSNVDTHIRTHTRQKSQHCPDCTFCTSDPGSLTRHRKRLHGYVPKQRQSRDARGRISPVKTMTATQTALAPKATCTLVSDSDQDDDAVSRFSVESEDDIPEEAMQTLEINKPGNALMPDHSTLTKHTDVSNNVGVSLFSS
ncbi:uncharacterized protein EV420DRAFT_1634301 [Desarmillaria tabescens]|uniref:C2H2-type domain-containing protein n=1 Tax=Armillaria tabescens TaxID=1929756 RepID=A0AA39NQD7_ARMTA|nr:uncharacterized protein EV420DRAFT_1634301 [Desarmillaria tabescens]KAK0469893.1 hypothetical protein EV420DRAFT_1634301 [Desarmillaria tabescens]